VSFAGLALAQDKVTVPLSNPSQPATIRVSLTHGSITVTAGSGSQVVIDSTSSSRRAQQPREVPPGMHRLDLDTAGLDIEEDHNVVTISGRSGRGADVKIEVPPNASLKLTTMSGGPIDVTGVSGEMEIDNMNGPITLKNVSGSVIAHSMNGQVTAALDRVTPNKPMAFTSMNGRIDVTIPADTKARLRLKSDHGEVYSDFDVKMEPDATKPVVEDARGQGGKYRIRMERGIYGSINGGGPEYRFETMNGNILIHKK